MLYTVLLHSPSSNSDHTGALYNWSFKIALFCGIQSFVAKPPTLS